MHQPFRFSIAQTSLYTGRRSLKVKLHAIKHIKKR